MSRDGSNNHEGLSQPRHCAGRIDGPAVGRRFLGSRAVRLQPITLRGRLVACATASRYFLADELLDRPVGDPDRTFVIFMCAYARDVLCGALPGPYTDADARRYARAALVPEELVDIERWGQLGRNLDRAAHALGVPIGELELMLAEASSAGREGGS